MTAYQKLLEFQDAVEKLTGYRPIISVSFHGEVAKFRDGVAEEIQEALCVSSNDVLVPSTHRIGKDEDMFTFTNYQAKNVSRDIEFNVFGPWHKNKEAAE